MASYLTTEDVRHFMMDRDVEDNELNLDLAFSDEEIKKAMERAARSFNSLPPFSANVNGNKLPGNTNMFLYGTAMHLMTSLLSKLRRNDVDYNAGGMGVNLVAKRIGHLQTEIAEFRALFEREVRDYKIQTNINYAYRSF